jgi:uncharacterized repeat protein (TIGR03837 family)
MLEQYTSLLEKPSFDIFCKVVDNFGDVGVAYRFARQLAHERGFAVRLIVDRLEVVKKFVPALDPALPSQFCGGMTFLSWSDVSLPTTYEKPADVVVETFGCSLPTFVMELMKGADTRWIDLEYLSAESWVPRFHAIPSPEPQTGLDRTLFFPGFTPNTGGLIREADLLKQRDAFQLDQAQQNMWRQAHALPAIAGDCVDISLFCYPSAPISLLAESLAQSDRPIRVFLTEGIPPETEQIISAIAPEVLLYKLAFLPQPDFDRLLWTCSLNFVRGEDSFVRAIWAGRPFIWNIYPQEKDAHLIKLRAFLDIYTDNVTFSARASLEKLLFLWNEGGSEKFDLCAMIPDLASEARAFTDQLAAHADLVSTMVAFLRRE